MISKYNKLTLAAGTLLAFSLTSLPAQAAPSKSAKKDWRELDVTASAYTIAADETRPGTKKLGLAAWGDILRPGMPAIAVSRDLIKKYNLGHKSRVRIEGLPGTYVVRDKMNKRWTNKIDILVPNKRQAREWGRRKVTIQWLP